MDFNSTVDFPTLRGQYSSPLNPVLTVFTVVGVLLNLASVLVKVLLKFAMPHTWKLSCLLLDVSHFTLGLGLALLLCYIRFQAESLCKAAEFFLMVGVLDCVCIYLISNVIILFVQYPEKLSGYSHYQKWTIPAMLVPEKVFTVLLALFPFLPISYFNGNDDPYVITCLPVRETGAKGAGYGAALMFISWIVLGIAIIVCMVTTFRLWKSSGGRIHASSPNIWQMMMLSQGKTYQRFLLLEQLVWMVVLFMTTVIIYTNTSRLLVPQWIAVVALSVSTFFHAVLSNIVTILWSTLCCRTKQQTKEPYQKLKKLELLKIEAPGKLRMKATWSVGKGVYRRGLLKVYGVDHLKAWAQEIVILGMMRKTQSASLLQCLWTNSGNPYFETMTLITGEIIPGESRLICFEFTNSGTLDNFLHHLDMPLPEPCQRTIIHDIAEGLSCLHNHNILHHKLTAASVFLKGSVQCMVLRAALGDFEAAQIYGSLQGGSSSSSQVSKKQFFLPDIRAFALVALEIIGFVCKKRQDEKQPFRKTRSEIVVSSQKGSSSKPREYVQDMAHKSRSLDERAILEETGFNNIPPFGSLINVKETDPHPNVPEEQDAWAQPVTSVRITSKHNEVRQTERELISRHPTDDVRWQKEGVPYISPKGYGHTNPSSVFRAGSPLHEHDYEEIEEITEKIQRDQIAIQQIRYPRKDDIRAVERPWKDYPNGGHYSVPTDVSNPRFIDQTQKPALPNRNPIGGGVFHRSDPLRFSASSVSTLEDIEEDMPEMTGESEHVSATLKDLWLKKEADKKERLLTSYNERMKKELKDVFSRRIRKRKDQGVSREAVQELSRPLSARSYHGSGTTLVVPFSAGETETHFGDAKQKRPQTALPAQRQISEGSGKPVPRRPAPPPPRPVTAAATTRPQTPGHGIKKTQARMKLKKALGQKQGSQLTNASANNTRGQGASVVEMKYASVKKIPQIKDSLQDSVGERPPPSRPQIVHPKTPTVGHFSSFSSNDSLGSSFYKNSPRKGDVSLTSGELTSLSSQADTTLPERDIEEVIEVPPTHETKGGQKGGKIIDSGFDSASITSEISCDVSMVDERSCSCPSGSYTTETCSCQCSITPTSGMHTKPLYDSRASWSKTDSFSSYDSTDLDQKLERLRNGDVRPSKDVIGPDEQYPMLAAAVKPERTAHQTQCSPHQNRKHVGKVVTKTQRTRRHDFGSASKRYKELRKKGVPLRVSVVSSASSQDVSDATDWDSYMESTAEVIEEEDDSIVDENDDAIFNALDSQGVFEPSDTDSSMGVRPLHHTKPVAVVHGTKRPHDTDNRTNAMILEDIIRELPDEITGASSMDDETRSFLHYSEPKGESNDEDEEEIVDMAIEIPYKPSSVVDAELVIDRLFTKRNTLKHKGSLQDVMDPILGFDENLIRELASPTGSTGKTDLPEQMLKGVTKTHVQACRELSSKVPLVPFTELFPATNGQFRVLRSRLEQVGNFGTIGKQLLDCVQLCWVSDSPPSASELVSRLLDTVTETEL